MFYLRYDTKENALAIVSDASRGKFSIFGLRTERQHPKIHRERAKSDFRKRR